MNDDCGCDYSFTCQRHQEVFELQARDARVEAQLDDLRARVERLEERIKEATNAK